MTILAFETSCDETSIAVLENDKILFNEISSQIDFHKEFGGVVPEMSSRMHAETLNLMLERLRKQFDFRKIDYVAFTNEPGLVGALQIGSVVARAVALALDKPIVPINHLHGHIYAANIDYKFQYPVLASLNSGGHTQIVFLKEPYDFEILAETNDDAIGEVFDKVAILLGFEYPGGPMIDKISTSGTNKIQFIKKAKATGENFSFSGVKTAVSNYIKNCEKNNIKINKVDVACSFQTLVISMVIEKMKKNIIKMSPKTIVLAGGVAANSLLRSEFLKLHANAIIPKMQYCTDNAAMIAKACQIKLTFQETKRG